MPTSSVRLSARRVEPVCRRVPRRPAPSYCQESAHTHRPLLMRRGLQGLRMTPAISQWAYSSFTSFPWNTSRPVNFRSGCPLGSSGFVPAHMPKSRSTWAASCFARASWVTCSHSPYPFWVPCARGHQLAGFLPTKAGRFWGHKDLVRGYHAGHHGE